MKKNPLPYFVLALAVLACNLSPAAQQKYTVQEALTLAAQTLQAQSPTPSPGLSLDQALTLAVETINAQATATKTRAPAQPAQPQPTKTKKPSKTPVAPTSTPGGLHVHPPILQISLIAPIQVLPINPKLNYQAAANYGEANLSAGFSPDPYQVGMTAGGSVNVSYLGSSCSGFASSAPDLRINFGGGGVSLLRIYFTGSNGDAAFVINDPYGNFYCVDDSFGTINPTIDFNNPAGGSYDVWVCSYAANTTISGTLHISENSGNHP